MPIRLPPCVGVAADAATRLTYSIDPSMTPYSVTPDCALALPAAARFLTHFDSSVYNVQVQARPYIGFATLVLLAMAVVFELPLFVVGLTRMGVLTTRQLRHNRRVGYFIVACIGVALPGIDPVTTFFETIPLAILYELSIWLSVLLDRRAARAQAAALGT